MTTASSFQFSKRARGSAAALLLLGICTAIYGGFAAPERLWPALLVNGFYAASLGVSAMFFLAAQRATGARWSASLRRIPEAFMPMVSVSSILILVLFFGRHVLYPWSRQGAAAGESPIAGWIRYLQPPWVYTRMALVFMAWISFAWLFRKLSLQQDRHPELALVLHHKLTRYAVMFIPIFAVTLTIAAFDWLISTDPSWFSTMYAVYVFAGTFVQGIAAVTLAVVILKERGPLRDSVSDHQLHDLGKMLFAFSTFWAYIWVGQYLLIWYGNIPDEVTHYVTRTNGPWVFLFALNLLANWVAPFLVLLSVRAKCTTRVLKVITVLLLGGHWLDLYLLATPSIWKAPRFGPLELAIAASYLALIFLVFERSLGRAPMVPIHDPILAYEQTHGTVHQSSVQRELRGAAQ